MTASEKFLAKYGHTCQQHTAIMADQIKTMRADNEALEKAMIRPGRLDPRGMIYYTGERVG